MTGVRGSAPLNKQDSAKCVKTSPRFQRGKLQALRPAFATTFAKAMACKT